MTDRILRADELRGDKALYGRISRRTLLCRVGIVAALEQAGAQPGDTVRIGPIEVEWGE